MQFTSKFQHILDVLNLHYGHEEKPFPTLHKHLVLACIMCTRVTLRKYIYAYAYILRVSASVPPVFFFECQHDC